MQVEDPFEISWMVSSLENAFCRYLSVFRRFSTTYSLQFTGKDPLVQDGLDTYFVQHTFQANITTIYRGHNFFEYENNQRTYTLESNSEENI